MENTLMWKEVVFFGLRSSITGIGRPFFLSELIIVVGGISLALGGVAPFLFAHFDSFFFIFSLFWFSFQYFPCFGFLFFIFSLFWFSF